MGSLCRSRSNTPQIMQCELICDGEGPNLNSAVELFIFLL